MKKLLKATFTLAIIALSFSSCTETELNENENLQTTTIGDGEITDDDI
ncbi:hypothetical protein [Lacinutrix sp. Hel_I_90]|nr:hypothetical protein [Lacinutrix sp. Hel_I_90]